MANSIIMVDFPITFSTYFYNMFRGFVEEKIKLRMQDESSCTVTNNGGYIRLNNFTDYTPAAGDVGENITIVGSVYNPASGSITGYDIGPDRLDTDIPYTAADTVRFFINRSNLRMKYRFCEFTTQDDQSATNLFGDSEFVFYPDNKGELYIDISIIKHLLKPSLTADNDYNTDMAIAFQVQYQTAYDGNSDTWHSAHDSSLPSFEAFLSVHATGRTAKINLFGDSLQAGLDTNLDGRLWRGYDKIFAILTPQVGTTNNIEVRAYEYNLSKTLILNNLVVSSRTAEDGVLIVKVDSISSQTRYLQLALLTDIFSTPNTYGTYLTVYDTAGDDTEFYISWVSENGTVRQWLFTNKALFSNKVGYDVLVGDEYRQIPNGLEEIITLEAKGISAIERQYISSLFTSNKIQIENNGNVINAIIDRPSWDYENRSNSYIVTFDLKLEPMAVMDV